MPTDGHPNWTIRMTRFYKVSDGCIRDLRFNSRLHKKLIGVLV